MLPRGVRVSSSARLHLGFYNILGEGVAYGSMGVAIDRPRAIVEVYPSDSLEVVDETRTGLEGLVEQAARALGVDAARIVVRESIPRHVGLGSTTQLLLSIGAGLSRLYGLGYTARELAVALGRGFVSGIGIACFEKGGFIVDSGRRLSSDGRIHRPRSVEDLPKPVLQVRVPSSWLFIVAVPRRRRGLSDSEEEPILEAPEPPSPEISLGIYRSFILGILPGIATGDPVLFGKALSRIQELVGRYFSKHQGGVFCCSETEYIVETMRELGVLGYGQSSWGPVAYGLVVGREAAEEKAAELKGRLKEAGVDAEVFIAAPRNTGAGVSYIQAGSPGG